MTQRGRICEVVSWNGVHEGFFEEEPAGATMTLREADGVAPEVVEVFCESQETTSEIEAGFRCDCRAIDGVPR